MLSRKQKVTDLFKLVNSQMQKSKEKSQEKCQEKFVHPSDLLRKVVALMENQITRDDINRHAGFIKSYLEYSQMGVVSF